MTWQISCSGARWHATPRSQRGTSFPLWQSSTSLPSTSPRGRWPWRCFSTGCRTLTRLTRNGGEMRSVAWRWRTSHLPEKRGSSQPRRTSRPLLRTLRCTSLCAPSAAWFCRFLSRSATKRRIRGWLLASSSGARSHPFRRLSSRARPLLSATARAWPFVGCAGVCAQMIVGGAGVCSRARTDRWPCLGASHRPCVLSALGCAFVPARGLAGVLVLVHLFAATEAGSKAPAARKARLHGPTCVRARCEVHRAAVAVVHNSVSSLKSENAVVIKNKY